MPAPAGLRLNLWTKLVVFTTLIVVVTCSALSWFFVQRQEATLTQDLLDRGTLLANHLAATSRYSVLVKDKTRVREQIAGLLGAEQIVYVMVGSADGQLIDAAGKGAWKQPPVTLFTPPAEPASPSAPTVRRVALVNGRPRVLDPAGFPPEVSESFYDIAVPVFGTTAAFDYDPALSLTLHEPADPTADVGATPPVLYGMVHVGISDHQTVALLQTLILQAVILTLIIIAAGLVFVLILAHRISAPVKALTSLASQVSQGNLSVTASPSSYDEVGELTTVFNVMVEALQAREQDLHDLNRTLESRVEARTEELQRANSRLQELNHLKTALVSTASHELRTPLTSMKVHVNNLLGGISGPVSPDQVETLRRVYTNIERLCRMIDDMLDLSHLQTGRVALEAAPVRLDHVIHDVLLTLNYYVAQKALSVRLDLPDSLCHVWGDEGKLRQVFSNLLHNAMKFTPAGGIIRIIADTSVEGVVTLCVSDDGCGIPPDEIEKIFLPFYRSPNGTQTRGSGLGLSIVKELVELQGGSVRAESTVHEGSRFFVRLPAVPQPSATARSDQQVESPPRRQFFP